MNIFCLLLWFSPDLFAQSIEIDRFHGLNDTDSPAVISDYEAQHCLNVESNLAGTALLKRHGFTREAALTVTTAPVTGSFNFTDDSGNNIVIVCHDRYCARSINDGAFSNFLSTAGGTGVVPVRWSFVAVDGDLYGANDRRDPILRYDGTTLSYPAGPLAGSILELTNDRLVIADTSANPSRVNYSQSGLYETFATGTSDISPWNDDIGSPGDRIFGIHFDSGRLYIFKRASVTSCIIGNQYTTSCYLLSSTIGTQDPNSIVSAPDGVYFKSQDRSYWKIANDNLFLISNKIQNFSKNQLTGSQRSNIQTSQSDWEAGTQAATGSWTTAAVSGSISPSSTTFLDTSSTNFSAGTFTRTNYTDVAGSVTLSSQTLTDNFNDNNFSAGTVWTVQVGDWIASTGELYNDSTLGRISADSSVSTGSFIFRFRQSGTPTNYIKFMSSSTNLESNGYAVRIVADTAIQTTIGIFRFPGTVNLCNVARTDVTAGTTYQYELWKSATGYMELRLGPPFSPSSLVCSATDTNFTTSNNALISSTGLGVIDDISFYGYRDDGQFLSRAFDTTYSTPTWGTFSVTSVTTNGTLSWFTQASTNNVDWTTLLGASDTVRIPSEQRRYLRYRGDFLTDVATMTPRINSAALIAATTGDFISRCIEPGTNISAWGMLSCSESLIGTGSLTYGTRVDTACTYLTTGTFTAQTNNATIVTSTQPAIQFRIRSSLLGSATDLAQVDACTMYWNEGSVAQPVWGVYDPIRNSLYWTATTTAASQGNRVLKYDLNLEQWYPFDLRATALSFVNNHVYFGSATGGYWNKYAPSGVDADNGSAINSIWQSKDFRGDSPFQETNFNRISLIAKNQVTGSMTATYRFSNNVATSYTVSLATTSGMNYVRSNHNVALASPQNFMNLAFSNNSAVPFEILGFKIGYTTQGWRPMGP